MEPARVIDTSVDLSLGEFRALVAKAGRGAGFTWGLADDLAYSAKRLAEFGVSSGAMVVALLDRIDQVSLDQLMPDEHWQSAAEMLCPICTGASLADEHATPTTGTSLDLGPVVQPVLLIALAATSLPKDDLACTATWEGGSCSATAHGVSFVGIVPIDPVLVSVRWIADAGEEKVNATRRHRVLLANDIFDRLGQLAQRTYAPSTDASREGGAGAGLLDDD